MSSLRCACCEGIEVLTPEVVANRPGLSALRYRVGTHATFFESMKARLSSFVLDVPEGDVPSGTFRALEALRTRRSDDPSIALLDAWACVADVLTFYQERIANEGYLRTATERRSVAELANLIGYRLRPGVASSVHLAFTLDPGYKVKIPAGTRAQNVPAPGETMQSFETSEDFDARTEWNNLAPRTGRPQVFNEQEAAEVSEIYLKGTATALRKGDALLLVLGDHGARVLRFVSEVDEQTDEERTRVVLRPETEVVPDDVLAHAKQKISEWIAAAPSGVNAQELVEKLKAWRIELDRPSPSKAAFSRMQEIMMNDFNALCEQATSNAWVKVIAWVDKVIREMDELGGSRGGSPPPDPLTNVIAPLAIQPARPFRPIRDVSKIFTRGGGGLVRSLTLFKPALMEGIYAAWKRLPVAPQRLEVYALRVKASPFGYNAPLQPEYNADNKLKPMSEWTEWDRDAGDDDPKVLHLESEYDEVESNGYVAVIRGDDTTVLGVTGAKSVSRTAYGLSSKSTRLTLDANWVDLPREGEDDDKNVKFIRESFVYAGSEKLDTVDAPMYEDVEGDTIELADLYDGLEAGHAIVVSGERTIEGLPEGTGVRVSELALLAGVRQGPGMRSATQGGGEIPGDSVHTTLVLSRPLTYAYKRSTVVVYGNVVKATHGETRSEVLGSGDATKPFQSFTIRQFPITHVSAPTTTGEDSTLEIRVNDVLWHASEGFPELGPRDRSYVEQQDDEQKTVVTFGDGRHGARLPTGFNNVTAKLRIGIGKPGNVAANSISLLSSKPLGVRDVINLLAATGGADRESGPQAVASIARARLAMGRLVSVSDYEAFSTTFAGIGKATARRIAVGRRFVVHVTIAGADDIPIDPTSDLFANVATALRAWGDPYQAVEVAVRDLVLPVISANVRIDPDYLWVKVEQGIREVLADRFGFARRAIGQSLFSSEIVAAMQSVPGVVYVDVDTLNGLTEQDAITQLAPSAEDMKSAGVVKAEPPRLHEDGSIVLPGQLAYVRPDMPDAIALKEITT